MRDYICMYACMYVCMPRFTRLTASPSAAASQSLAPCLFPAALHSYRSESFPATAPFPAQQWHCGSATTSSTLCLLSRVHCYAVCAQFVRLCCASVTLQNYDNPISRHSGGYQTRRAPEQNQRTGLIHATKKGHLDVARLLLERGASVNLADTVRSSVTVSSSVCMPACVR